MRAARYAIVAGAVCLQSLSAQAGEGSSLRGLRIPPSALDAEAVIHPFSGGTPRLKRNGDTALPQVVPPRLFLSGGTTQAQRATAKDTEYRLAFQQPTGQDIPALAGSNIHTLVNALPRYTLHTDVTRSLPGGWGLGFGLRETEYSFSTRNLLSFSAHRDFGNFRGAYTLYSDRAEGAGLGSAHRFEVRYLYGERNTIGLSYTTGRDIDNVGLAAPFFSSEVRDWSLSGRHWLTPNWALTYDVLSQDQGSLYRRQGLRLGVSRSF